MSCPALTNKGGKLYISDQPVDCDLTLSELAVLDYVFVPGVGSIGDTGIEQDVVTYPTTDSGLTPQGKGDAVARNWDIEVLDAPSEARDILDEASAIGNDDNYATRIEWPNGDVEFSIVQVASRTAIKGAASGVRVIRYTMVPSFIPIVTNALPVASNVVVSGTYATGETLTATYDYYSPLGFPESGSVYQWYADGVAIPGADGLTYVIDLEYEGQMISFGVEPSDGLSFGPEARSTDGGPVIFTPEILFEGGIYGGLFSTAQRLYNGQQSLFQDAAGTIPVTEDGDEVRRINDHSGGGNHITGDKIGTYHTDGVYEWITPNGTSDFGQTAPINFSASTERTMFAAMDMAEVIGIARVVSLHGTNITTNGCSALFATAAGVSPISYRSRGTVAANREDSVSASGVHVYAGLSDIAAPTTRLWKDGARVTTSSSNQGTGNGPDAPFYLFRNGETAGVYNDSPWYGGMLINRLLSDEQTQRVSTYFEAVIPWVIGAGNAATSWWCDPAASNNGITVFGFSASNGQFGVLEFDNTTHDQIDVKMLGNPIYTQDDHNEVSVKFLDDGALIIAVTGHKNSFMGAEYNGRIGCYYSPTGRIADLGAVNILPSSLTGVNYSQWLNGANRLVLLTNDDNTNTWLPFYSDDKSAGGFVQGRAIFNQTAAPGGGANQVYARARMINSSTARLVATAHPSNARNPLSLVEMSIDSGSVWYTETETSIGTFTSSGTPLSNITSLPVIYTPPVGYSCRLLDVSPNGSMISIAEFLTGDGTAAIHYLLVWDGATDRFTAGAWSKIEVGATGAAFDPTRAYFGSMVFATEPHTGMRVYRCREEDGSWYLDREDSSDGGVTWVTTNISSSADNVIPRCFAPEGSDGNLSVIRLEGSYAEYSAWSLSAKAF